MQEDTMENNYSEVYNEESFWEKHTKFAIKAGRDIIEKVLILYFCLIDPDTPGWAKTVILAALGYFIMPLDAIPDFTPVIGYADDLGLVAAALATVAVNIKPEHREKAIDILKTWFGQ
jgi:uncharacterized membrane protein YkvA (DUF1232 family)